MEVVGLVWKVAGQVRSMRLRLVKGLGPPVPFEVRKRVRDSDVDEQLTSKGVTMGLCLVRVARVLGAGEVSARHGEEGRGLTR
jgi:hypothetical protein